MGGMGDTATRNMEHDTGAFEGFEITRERFGKVIDDPDVQHTLDELDVDETDRADLFDMLDGDGSGTLSIDEIVTGIMAVRGQAKKSDIIATKLGVKAVQHSLHSFEEG